MARYNMHRRLTAKAWHGNLRHEQDYDIASFYKIIWKDEEEEERKGTTHTFRVHNCVREIFSAGIYYCMIHIAWGYRYECGRHLKKNNN